MQKSSITITDINAFQEIINSIEESCKKIKDTFENENKNKEIINRTNTWTGESQQAMYNKLTQLSRNFPGIESSCEVYIKFLKKTLNDYVTMINDINKNTNDVAASLDVNS